MPQPLPEVVLNTGWETILYVIPCSLLGIAALFRLDRVFSGLNRRVRSHKSCTICDGRGHTWFCDPDGRLFHVFRHSKSTF